MDVVVKQFSSVNLWYVISDCGIVFLIVISNSILTRQQTGGLEVKGVTQHTY